MSKQNYAVCCYTCEHNGQETCKGCNTILNGKNEPYENWQLREDLCQKDEQIADLQHRLEVAEKEKEIEKLRKLHSIRDDASQCEIVNGVKFNAEQIMIIALLKENMTLATNEYKKLYFDSINRIKELENQLQSQPAEIVEKIRKQIFNHFNVNNMEEYESLSLLDSLFTADAVTDMLDDILKEYQK